MRRCAESLVCSIALLWGASGCGAPPARIGYFLDSSWNPILTRRVVLVELAPDKGPSEVADGLTESLYKALQSKMLFHVDVVARTSPVCRDLPLSKRGNFSLTELENMREELQCDAVVFGSVTLSTPYPRQQVGVYLLMLDLRGGRLLWGIDHTWDTTDKLTEERLKDYFSENMRDGYGPADWRLARMSPRMFHEFVAREVSATLPDPNALSTGR